MVHTIRISTYDEFDGTVNKIVQERKGQNIFVLLFGTENPDTGKSWCPDCVKADPLIRKHLEEESPVDSVLIEVPVGTREEYKGRPDNPYRLHPRIQLKSIPTLIKWTENVETDKRLVEEECARDNLLSAFFSA